MTTEKNPQKGDGRKVPPSPHRRLFLLSLARLARAIYRRRRDIAEAFDAFDEIEVRDDDFSDFDGKSNDDSGVA